MATLRSIVRVGVVFLLLAACTGLLVAAQPGWQAGVAAVKVTPDKPLWMAGYGSRVHPSEGTLQELWLKALAVEASDGGRAVVVGSDLLGFPRDVAAAICQGIAERCGLERSRIMLTSTHTHCGPVLEGALYDVYPLDDAQRALIADYSKALVPKAVDAVAKALAKLEPATLAGGQGETTFANNRRNNTEAQFRAMQAAGIKPKGPNDHDVPVLAVRTPGGALRAAVFGYACHNTTLSFYQWCGDYSGFAMADLEAKYPGLQAIFYMGCGADQNPMPRREVELCQKYGAMLAAAVGDVVEKPMHVLAPRLRVAFARIDLPFGEQPTREQLLETSKKKNYESRWAARLLTEMDQGKPFRKSYPYPIQVWKLGDDQLWIALGGEVVVDYAILLKAKYGRSTWVTGYANDVMSYIPSRRIWEEGRYESGAFAVYGLPALRWCEDIQERIMTTIDRLVAEVKSKEAKP